MIEMSDVYSSWQRSHALQVESSKVEGKALILERSEFGWKDLRSNIFNQIHQLHWFLELSSPRTSKASFGSYLYLKIYVHCKIVQSVENIDAENNNLFIQIQMSRTYKDGPIPSSSSST
jgi:hypothetical protein